jgi:ferredoxin
MANKNSKYTSNVLGKYYVDKSCIACDACTGIANEFFKMNDDEGHAYVYNQPDNKEDYALCEEALEACPVLAIGNDGV